MLPAPLARELERISTTRGFGLSGDELADAVRLFHECGAAHHGQDLPPGSQAGLLPRLIPVGSSLPIQTPTVMARLKITEAMSWAMPAAIATAQARREYYALLVAWILHHGRSEKQLALLTADSAPAIVQDLRGKCPVTIEELDAAFAEVVADLYPAARIMDKYEALADQEADKSDPSVPQSAIRNPQSDIDWAAILLCLVTEAGGSVDQWLAAYEPRVFHVLAAIRRRRDQEAAAVAASTRGAPDPQCPKSRAARAWNAFEQSLLQAKKPA